MTMDAELQVQLREALSHLYDPGFEPAEALWECLGVDPADGPQALLDVLAHHVERLAPDPTVPSGARIRRLYDILCLRYIAQLSQEEVAERLSISPRHLRREQTAAIRLITESILRGDSASDSPHEPPETTDWRAQVRAEIALLHQSSDDSTTSTSSLLRGVGKLARALADRHGVEVQVDPGPANLTVMAPLCALRQVLLGLIAELLQHMSSGTLSLQAIDLGTEVELVLDGSPTDSQPVAPEYLVHELLTNEGGELQVHEAEDRISLRLRFPSATHIRTKVLAIDDNPDLIHFYQRYTAGTRYEIVPLADGTRVLEALDEIEPSIVVLDVMLPGVDGWELLTQIREHPFGSRVPVVVCSVMHQEELARALGADLYVSKPVRRRDLIAALDQAFSLLAPVHE